MKSHLKPLGAVCLSMLAAWSAPGAPGDAGTASASGSAADGGAGTNRAAATSVRYLDEVFGDVAVTRNLSFGARGGAAGDTARLLLDLYEPAGDTAPRRPAIVWIHGGGFYKGDRKDGPMSYLADRFARRGYVTVSIDYRLASRDAVDPASPTFSKAALAQAVGNAAADARAALDWLRDNAARFRIDAERIAIGGGSAGAFTALRVAFGGGGTDGTRDPHPPGVRAVVDFWGGLLDAGTMKAGDPPLLVIHGTADPMVSFSFAGKLVARAKEVGVVCEFHPLDGEGHAAWRPMDRHVRWVASFLNRHMIEAR